MLSHPIQLFSNQFAAYLIKSGAKANTIVDEGAEVRQAKSGCIRRGLLVNQSLNQLFLCRHNLLCNPWLLPCLLLWFPGLNLYPYQSLFRLYLLPYLAILCPPVNAVSLFGICSITPSNRRNPANHSHTLPLRSDTPYIVLSWFYVVGPLPVLERLYPQPLQSAFSCNSPAVKSMPTPSFVSRLPGRVCIYA